MNCDWKSYTFSKKYPPAHENDQNSQKSAKWPKITFPGSEMVPKVSIWGVLVDYLYWKVILELWFAHPKCHFRYPQNSRNDLFWLHFNPKVYYPARALRALGLLLADGAPQWGGGKLFEPSTGFFYGNCCNSGAGSRKIDPKVGNEPSRQGLQIGHWPKLGS